MVPQLGDKPSVCAGTSVLKLKFNYPLFENLFFSNLAGWFPADLLPAFIYYSYQPPPLNHTPGLARLKLMLFQLQVQFEINEY